MTSPIRSREEPLYTPSEPEDLVCKADSSESGRAESNATQSSDSKSTVVRADGSRSTAGEPAPLPARSSEEKLDIDYLTVSVGAGEFVGGGIAITLDRFGHLYAGVGAGAGVSALPATGSIHRGTLVDSTVPEKDEEGRLQEFLEGDAVEATTSLGAEASVVNSRGGTAVEVGVGVAQVGVQFQHNWHILQLPVRW